MMTRIRVFAIVWVIFILLFIIFTELWTHYYTMFELHASLRDMAATIHKACAENGILYWISCGTLLGSFREGNIIAHDDDIDLCILDKDLPHLMEILPRYGLEIKKFLNGLYKVTAPCKQGIIDIFVCVQDGAFYRYIGYGEQMFPNEKYEIDDDFSTLYMLGTHRVHNANHNSFEPLILRGPSREHAQNYLLRTYGRTWTQPRVSFVHTFTAMRHTFWFSLLISIFLLILVPCILNIFNL